MNLKRFLIFGAVTVTTVALALWIAGLRAPERAIEKTPAFPGLMDRVNDIARVEIRGSGKETAIAKTGEKWVVANRGNYPAQFEKIKPLVIGIAQLEILEQKTSNPELYAKLGVEDMTAKDAASRQVSLQDAGGKTIAALLVGKEPGNLGVQAPDALYIRRLGEAPALLVQGRVKADADPANWVDTKLADIASTRIKELVLTPVDGTPVVIRKGKPEDKTFTLAAVPKGMKVKSQGVVESLATLLQDFNFEDVMAETEAKLPDKLAKASYKTFDGLVTTIMAVAVNARTHARFEFSFDPAAAKKPANPPKPEDKKAPPKPSVADEAKRLQDLTRGWVYVLPEFKGELLRKTFADLVASAKEDKPPKAAGKSPANATMPEFPTAEPIPAQAVPPSPRTATGFKKK